MSLFESVDSGQLDYAVCFLKASLKSLINWQFYRKLLRSSRIFDWVVFFGWMMNWAQLLRVNDPHSCNIVSKSNKLSIQYCQNDNSFAKAGISLEKCHYSENLITRSCSNRIVHCARRWFSHLFSVRGSPSFLEEIQLLIKIII